METLKLQHRHSESGSLRRCCIGCGSRSFVGGEVEHHIVAPLLVVKFGQGGCGHLLEGLTGAVNVDGGVEGCAHRFFRGAVFSRYVVAGAVVGRCAHKWKSGGEVHARVHGEGFEWSQALVVIHGQYAVEFGVQSVAEKNPSAA